MPGMRSRGARCGLCEEGAMQPRSFIWIGVFIGSTIGSLIPGLWGDDMFSYSSVLLGGAGALMGLWIGFKMST